MVISWGTVFDPHKMRKNKLKDNQKKECGEKSAWHIHSMFQSLPFSIVHKGLYQVNPASTCHCLVSERVHIYVADDHLLEGNPVSLTVVIDVDEDADADGDDDDDDDYYYYYHDFLALSSSLLSVLAL